MRRVLPTILLLIGSVAECLQLNQVQVPHYKKVGEMATLHCQFNLGRDRLYTVQWYKDNEEFFRYVPRFNPSIHVHPVAGVDVDSSRSTFEVVILKSVGVKSSGVYKCEVSAEGPSFASFSGEGRMTVVYLPKDGPQITGNLRDEYEVGDMLDLNCTSSKSFPPARISWYINDILVTGQAEPLYYHYDTSMEFSLPKYHPSTSSSSGSNTISSANNLNGHNLIRSTSRRLLLELTSAHFDPKGTAKIRCVARIFPLFWQDGDEKKIDHKNSTKQYAGPARHHQQNHRQNEVDDGSPTHFPQFHERSKSLYKGEALVQIRGGCDSVTSRTLLPTLLILFMVLFK